MLTQRINDDLKIAMKEKQMQKLSVLRVLKSEIDRASQGPKGKVEVGDADVIKIIKRMAEGINSTTKDQTELSVLNQYVPAQLSEDQIKNIVTELKDSGVTAMGDIMKHFKNNYDGQYDGKTVSNFAK